MYCSAWEFLLNEQGDSLKSELDELKDVRFVFNNSTMIRKNKDGKDSKDGKEKW